MSGETSEIPVGTQFSPNLIDLKAFLQALVAHSGDREAMRAAVWSPPVNLRKAPTAPTKRTASLPLEAAVQYGLLDSAYAVTDLAVSLADLDGPKLYEEFARHILFNLGGLRVVEGAQQMKMDGHKVTANGLAAYLTDQGFRVSIQNTAINSLRMWLARAGLFPEVRADAWEVDESVKEKLVGFDDETIAALVGLTDDQRAYVLALCRIDPEGDYSAAEVRDLAETMVGHRLDRSNLPKTFLNALAHAGLITFQTGGTQSGKTTLLRTTDKFRSDVLEVFLEKTTATLDAALTAYYRKSPATIYAELDSTETFVKGEALEAYAIHIMRLLGLRFVAWRKRARDETGHAEIDAIMSGLMGGVATRWQVQCKNTPAGRVTLEDVAKEIGLTPITKATHVLIVANCPVTTPALTLAEETMRNSSLSVMVIDKKDFDKIRASPGAIAPIVRTKSLHAASLQRHGINWLT